MRLLAKRLLIFILIFATGFVTHMLVFPDFIPQYSQSIQRSFKNVLGVETQKKDQSVQRADPLEIVVVYKDGDFAPSQIIIPVTRYIEIQNASKTELMWLVSDNKLLNTDRGYGQGEQLRAQLNDKGTFFVKNKLEPQHSLIITVK